MENIFKSLSKGLQDYSKSFFESHEDPEWEVSEEERRLEEIIPTELEVGKIIANYDLSLAQVRLVLKRPVEELDTLSKSDLKCIVEHYTDHFTNDH